MVVFKVEEEEEEESMTIWSISIGAITLNEFVSEQQQIIVNAERIKNVSC